MGKDTSYGVNLQILALLVSFLVTWLLLNRTNIGRQIYAMGGNADAAQRLGFHIFALNMLVYCYMGVMAGIASLVQAQLAQSVAPTVLVGKKFDVVAAVVLGGASLMGGVGTVLGTFLGLSAPSPSQELPQQPGRSGGERTTRSVRVRLKAQCNSAALIRHRACITS